MHQFGASLRAGAPLSFSMALFGSSFFYIVQMVILIF